MSELNCYIPITVRITGRPSDAQLDALGETLVRALEARIAFAEQTLSQGQSEGRLFGEAREAPDATRFFDGTYELPAYDRGGRLRRVAVRSTADAPTPAELPLLSDFLDYAFFFTSDRYGRAAQDFVRAFYPQHRRFRARSFEHMFRLLLRDIRRHMRQTGRRAHVSEIVLVTHAIAAGRIFIPLTEGRPRRTFTPADLAELQDEFRRGLHRRFREERRAVVGALDESTRIVVRGCNVGQAQETLDALRLFFGGRPHVFAPTRFQHFRGLEIARSFAAVEDAFDFLIDQGYLPDDQRDRPDAEKRRYIRETFGDWLPSEGFITTREEVEWVATLRGGRLTDEQRRRLEEILIRPSEQAGVVPGIPTAGEFWGHSGPRDRSRLWQHDPELEALSAAELVAEARRLLDPYRAENAPRILRVLDALFSPRALGELIQAGMIDVNDPLAGLPDPSLYPHIFGAAPSLETLETDAAGYPSDPFEEVTLPREEITAGQRAEEARQLATVRGLAAASVPTGPRETDYTARGGVETLPDGIRLWNFPVSRARLRAEFQDPLRQIAQQAIANPNLRIAVEGHTSSSGSVRANERLSQERALAVAQFLIEAGVPAGQIEAQGHGESELLEREQGRHGELMPRRMARNRRVEIRLVSQPTAPTAPAAPSPTEAELEAILQRLGPPPASRPEWIMWVFDALTAAGHGKKVSWLLGKFAKVDIQFRLDVASFIQLGAWTIFAPLASYAEGQALGYANGAKRGFAEALNTMAGSVHDPPDGHIYYPSDEVPLDLVAWPYSEGLQDGYRHGVRTAVKMIKEMQQESPHGGEIFLLALRHLYYDYLKGITPAIIDLLGGYQRRFRTPSPVDPILRLLGEEVE